MGILDDDDDDEEGDHVVDDDGGNRKRKRCSGSPEKERYVKVKNEVRLGEALTHQYGANTADSRPRSGPAHRHRSAMTTSWLS